MATDNVTQSEIDDLFRDEDPNTKAPVSEASGKPSPKLAAALAAKQAAGDSVASAASNAGTTTKSAGTDATSSAGKPSDAGTPEGEITPKAQDELARLAAKRGNGKAPKPGTAASATTPPSAPSSGDGSESATAPASDSELPDTIPGLIESAEGPQAAGTLYEQRQQELAAARAKRGGKTMKKTAKQIAAEAREKAKVAADKAKAKEKEKAEKEKARAKEKTEKQKAAEQTRKDKEKASKAARDEREAARKKEIADRKAARRAEIEAARVPMLIGRENKATQAAFAEDYQLAGPKTERVPLGQGVRRAKSDRGDFAAGWIMAMRRMRRDIKAGSSTARNEPQASGAQAAG